MTIKVSIPSGPELPLDEEQLATLLEKSLSAAVRDLGAVTPQIETRTIYRPTSNGWAGVPLPFPNYRCSEVWDAVALVWNSKESGELMDYLWDRGALKTEISTELTIPPGKEVWGRHIWAMLIHPPLFHLLRKESIVELTESGTFTPWRVNGQELHSAALDGARRLVKNGRHVVAVCPIVGLSMNECDRFDTEPGVSVSRMTESRKRLLLSNFEAEFLDEDFSSWASTSVIEFDQVLPETSDDDVTRLVAGAIDRVKWAILQCMDGTMPLMEGPVIVRGPGGWRGRTIRRGEGTLRGGSLPNYQITAGLTERIARLVESVRAAQTATGELEQAVWHFGRACTASMGRDVVLESTIGLEHLLVPDPGESTYKFCLHGLALLSRLEGDSVADDLGKIYGMRSKVAHGSSKSERELAEMAPRARRLLAQAIQAVAEGINSGTLDVSQTKGDIGKAVKTFVFARVKADRSG